MSFYFEVLMPNLGDSSGNFVGIFQIETRNPTLQYGRPQGDGATHNAVYNWSNFAGGGTKESIIRKIFLVKQGIQAFLICLHLQFKACSTML